jgi:hypothetical protein
LNASQLRNALAIAAIRAITGIINEGRVSRARAAPNLYSSVLQFLHGPLVFRVICLKQRRELVQSRYKNQEAAGPQHTEPIVCDRQTTQLASATTARAAALPFTPFTADLMAPRLLPITRVISACYFMKPHRKREF